MNRITAIIAMLTFGLFGNTVTGLAEESVKVIESARIFTASEHVTLHPELVSKWKDEGWDGKYCIVRETTILKGEHVHLDGDKVHEPTLPRPTSFFGGATATPITAREKYTDHLAKYDGTFHLYDKTCKETLNLLEQGNPQQVFTFEINRTRQDKENSLGSEDDAYYSIPGLGHVGMGPIGVIQHLCEGEFRIAPLLNMDFSRICRIEIEANQSLNLYQKPEGDPRVELEGGMSVIF